MNAESQPAESGGGGAGHRPSLLRVRVEAWVLGIVAMIAFGGGFVFGGLGDDAPASDPGFEQVPPPVESIAPPLDDSQLRGGLPSGHPAIAEPDAPGTPTSAVPGDAASTTSLPDPPPPTTMAGG